MAEMPFALTNDDAGSGDPALFAELLDFLAAQRAPATFFVVPAAGGVPLTDRPEWLRLLRRALDEGHELQLHGYNHGVFEFGVPPGFMLDIIPDAKARWAREPEAVRAEHTLQILNDKIAHGKEIFRRALGYDPVGFRSGCLAIGDDMYRALAGHGFRWSSNLVVNPMGWRYINRDYDAGDPWQPGVPPHPFPYKSGLIEVPMLSEYTWHLHPEDVERHFALARADFDRTRREGGAFLSLSHFYAMTGEWRRGLQVYERLFDHARAQGAVQFCTVSQLLELMPPQEVG